jgi:tetratricopeptide (TPR) repeat protein
MAGRMSCLDENAALRFALGKCTPQERAAIDRHIDGCPTCRGLVSEAMGAGDGPRAATRADRPQAREAAEELPAPTQPDGDAFRPLPRGSAVGRYLVLQPLGSGGMAVVYEAYDPELDRRVAVKILRADPEPALAKEQRARMVREAQALARIAHPHVVQVFDVGELGDRVFIAMELVEGVTLRRWLAEKTRSRAEILDIFRQCGRARSAAHRAGLVHRDFKPENVLVDARGVARVTDFGLARAELSDAPAELAEAASSSAQRAMKGRLTRPGHILGTPKYIAPETIFEGRATAAADQFAFCVALYEALFGQDPFPGSSVMAVARAAREGELRPAPSGARVPPTLAQAVCRGLSGQPNRRFASMDDLVAALAEDAPVGRRRRWPLAAAAAVALLAGAGLGYHLLNRPAVGACPEVARASWGPAAREQVRQALLATHTPFSDETAARTVELLDGYSAALSGALRQACASSSTARADPTVGRAADCLQQRDAELSALVAVLSRADLEVTRHAVAAAASLPGVESCEATFAGRASPSPRPEALLAALARARALAACGPTPEAVNAARDSLQKARAASAPGLEAEAWLALGRVQHDREELAAAEESFYQAAWLAEGAGDDDVAASAPIELVPLVGCDEARPADGRRCAGEAQAALVRRGPSPELQAQLETGLARLAEQEGRYLESQSRFEGALALRERAADSPERVRALVGLGRVLAREGRLEEGLEKQKRALAVEERLFGPRHPEMAALLSSISGVLLDQGNPTDALAYAERALAIDSSALGDAHPEVARALLQVGASEIHLGRGRAAEEHLDRALSIQSKALGLEHPDLARTLLLQGGLAYEESRDEDARTLLSRALEICRQGLGPDAPLTAEVLQSRAEVELRAGDAAAAEKTLGQAARIREKALGPEHPDLALTQALLGRAYQRLGRWDEATALLVPAAQRLTSALGPAHPQLATALEGVAEAHLHAGALPEAATLFERALGLRQKRPGLRAELADAELGLARSLAASDPPRARELALKARAAYAEAGRADLARRAIR